METTPRLTWEEEAEDVIREIFEKVPLSSDERRTINCAIRGLAAANGEISRSGLLRAALNIRTCAYASRRCGTIAVHPLLEREDVGYV